MTRPDAMSGDAGEAGASPGDGGRIGSEEGEAMMPMSETACSIPVDSRDPGAATPLRWPAEDPEAPGPVIVCILGMHRSGTSLLARMVNFLGVDLGPEEHFLPAAADNPKGFWENQRLMDLNEEILRRHGGGWSQPPAFPPAWHLDPGLDDLRRKGSAILAEDFGGARCWGWKDPRTCLTLPFWQDLLPPMRYVMALRDPVDVARSLERRNRMPLEQGIGLWLSYLESALVHASGKPRIFVFYEDLLDNWRDDLPAMGRFLGADERASRPETLEAIEAFVDKDLHHHRKSKGHGPIDGLSAIKETARRILQRLTSPSPAPAATPGKTECLVAMARSVYDLMRQEGNCVVKEQDRLARRGEIDQTIRDALRLAAGPGGPALI
jgi:hypothetical protein